MSLPIAIAASATAATAATAATSFAAYEAGVEEGSRRPPVLLLNVGGTFAERGEGETPTNAEMAAALPDAEQLPEEEDDSPLACPICDERRINGSLCAIGHVACSKCIKDHIAAGHDPVCPFCRSDLDVRRIILP